VCLHHARWPFRNDTSFRSLYIVALWRRTVRAVCIVSAWNALRRAPGIPKRAAQHELYLAVQAAQVVIRPPLHRVQQLAVHTEKK